MSGYLGKTTNQSREGIATQAQAERESQFGEMRWLAAPMITRQIQDGIFVFTPDASREEAERIVRGVNNVVAKLNKKFTF